MIRGLRSASGLCRRAVFAVVPTAPVVAGASAGAPRTAVSGTAAAGALTGGTLMRVMGYDVKYSHVLATALAVGFGAYTYESLVLAKEGAAPLQSEMARRPDIKSLKMTDHSGKQFTAQQLLGKWCLLDFGSLDQPADLRGLNAVCRASEASQQRSGVAVTPVYLSLSPDKDRPEDLKRVVAAAGHPSLVALTGNADGVLECAHKFKAQEKAARGDAALDSSYVSSFVYLVTPSGEFARLWPKDVPLPLLSDAVSRAVKE
ncbi:SCO2-like protein [Chlorella vulgaris]